jgi:hypothetical protein
MGILDLLGGQKAPQPAYQPPTVPASDPTTFALEQFTKGKATPEQKQMVSKLPAQVVSDAVSKRDAEMFKIEVPDAAIPSDILDRQRAAKAKTMAQTASAPVAMPAPVAIPKVKTSVVANQAPISPPVAPQDNAPQISQPKNMTTRTVGLGTPDISPTVPTQASGGAVPPTIVSGAIVRDTATKGGPEAANAVAQAMDKPVTKEQAVAATDAVDKFLKDNPDGGTLANILDVVGVALSAYGGTQRETMLQQRNKARMALSQQQALAQQQFELQQALAQQGYGQQEKMAGIGQKNAIELKGMDQLQQLAVQQKQLENEMLLKQKDYDLAVAKGDTSQIALKNDLTRIAAQRDANLENQKSLILFQTRMGGGANVVDKAAQNLLETPK